MKRIMNIAKDMYAYKSSIKSRIEFTLKCYKQQSNKIKLERLRQDIDEIIDDCEFLLEIIDKELIKE